MLGCKPANTPIESNHKLGEKYEEPIVDRGIYQRMVGKLIYLLHAKPDVVSMVNQFMHSPFKSNMEAVYKIIEYLKTAPDKGVKE